MIDFAFWSVVCFVVWVGWQDYRRSKHQRMIDSSILRVVGRGKDEQGRKGRMGRLSKRRVL